MNDADALRHFQPRDNLEHGIDGLGGRYRAATSDLIFKGASGDQFHCNQRNSTQFLRAKNIYAIGMIDRSRQTAFPEKAVTGFGRIKGLAQHLESDAPSALQVFGFKNVSHAAAPEGPDNSVMPKLFARLGQSGSERLGGHDDCPFRADLRWGRQAGFEEAFGTKLRQQITRQFRAALRTPAFGRNII